MNLSIFKMLCASLLFASSPALVVAQQIITLGDVEEGLPEISADEAIADQFSAEKAAEYLDRSALNWQKTKKCATCHSNMGYLWARPALSSVLEDSGEVRAFYEDYRKVRWAKKGPSEKQGFWPIVVGAGLTFNDLQTTGKLSKVAREVLDIMWTVQRKDGGWRWPDCDYAPLEIDDHYGATVAALIVGIAPDGYAGTPAAKAGLEKLREYFKNDPPKSLHHRAMLAWVSKRIDGIVSAEQRQRTLDELLALQLDDGGWSTAAFLTDWKGGLEREDGKALATDISDGYGTGLVIVIARDLGVAADDPRLQKGIAWLKANQRESGKWFTRSPVVEAMNLISNIGSAYAVLAMQACGELPGWPLEGAEPTNAKEAAAQEAAAKASQLDADYQALVVTLPADQQAWEEVLQENLGGFYLPIHKRQKIAGQSNAWDFIADDSALPRVLLIGDSVSRGYTQAVRKALAGKVNVHRAPANCGPTATGLKKLDVWLGDGQWDLIHFNFGIHDRNTPLPDYTGRLDQLVDRLQETGAKVVWATTTPIPDLPEKKQSAASIIERNAAAAEVMKKHGVAIDDLFTAITPHLAALQNPDDVHFNAKGYDFLGRQVAQSIEKNLK